MTDCSIECSIEVAPMIDEVRKRRWLQKAMAICDGTSLFFLSDDDVGVGCG